MLFRIRKTLFAGSGQRRFHELKMLHIQTLSAKYSRFCRLFQQIFFGESIFCKNFQEISSSRFQKRDRKTDGILLKPPVLT